MTEASIAGAAIRPERADDRDAIRTLTTAAFGGDAEAGLVDALRQAGALAISLVAVIGDAPVGHIAFSPMTLAPPADPRPILGLAPLAVAPAQQRRGLGGALVAAGLQAARDRDCALVCVLGDPGYYRRFGFTLAAAQGVCWDLGAPEHFMLLRLQDDLRLGTHTARYHPAFAEL